MKRHLFTFLLIIAFTNVFAGKDDEIKSLVYRWNELHNTHNTIEFLTVYAPTVLFYGKTTDINTCFNLKTRFLKTGFQQEIITPVTLTYYTSGTVKCDFTKRTKTAKSVREHLCYLLVKKINGKYLITGESDLVTDQNRNVVLDLGDEKFLSKKLNLKYWALFAVLLVIALLAFIAKRRKENNPILPTANNDTPVTALQTPLPASSPNKTDSTDDIIAKVKTAVVAELKDLIIAKQTVKEKGDDFEKYVVEQFDETYFKILEWRSDKYHNGKYAISNTLPDLEYRFKKGYKEHRFAIECKWRADYNNNELEWAKPDQLNRYRDFERKNSIPVFILIGLGGKPIDPEHLFVVPLYKIYSAKLNKYQLQKFERKTRGTFDFDPMQNMLY